MEYCRAPVAEAMRYLSKPGTGTEGLGCRVLVDSPDMVIVIVDNNFYVSQVIFLSLVKVVSGLCKPLG